MEKTGWLCADGNIYDGGEWLSRPVGIGSMAQWQEGRQSGEASAWVGWRDGGTVGSVDAT